MAITETGAFEFGHYQSQPIRWNVLTVNANNVLLISEKVLDVRKYNDSFGEITWETCSLRRWLNESFLQNAFDESEKNLLIKQREIGEQDFVFLFNDTEVKRYFASDDARKCYPADQVKSNSLSHDKQSGSYCQWWLRQPDNTKATVSSNCVDTNGKIVEFAVNYSAAGVRPAIMINLNA